MLPVCISTYLKSVMRNGTRYLILATYHPDILNVNEDMRILGYSSKWQGACEQISVEKYNIIRYTNSIPLVSLDVIYATSAEPYRIFNPFA
jgi:hypothetical protein